MSTDSTELTFVRCPSCRSLVPAISSRCRMCGATIDAAVKPEEEADRGTRPPSRVRQRTMSQPGSELNEVTDRVRDESSNKTRESMTVVPVREAVSDEVEGAPGEMDVTSPYSEEVAAEPGPVLDAPPDLGAGEGGDALPARLVSELAKLGLA